MKSIVISVIVIVLIAVAGVGGFWAGDNFGPNAQSRAIQREFFAQRTGQGSQTQNGQQGQFGQGGAARRGAFGTVKSVEGNTIQMTRPQDGSTITVKTDSQTVLQKTSVVSATLSDIKPGEVITVVSDQTGDNVTARQITIQAAGQ